MNLTGSTMDSKMKAKMVFVFPYLDAVGSGVVECFTYSLGIGYIRAYLAEKGIPTEQYIQYESRTVSQTAAEILAMGIDIIGFSCLEDSFFPCALIAREIKKRRPGVTIIFGGPIATLADRLVMENNPFIDICCRGESEELTYELLQHLMNHEDLQHEDLQNIEGLTFRKNGSIIRTQDRPLQGKGKKDQELDYLPSPYLSHMIPVEVQIGNRLMSERTTILITARGCTHTCTYCANSALCRNKVRYHSVERVIDEIKFVSERIKPGQLIMFADDAFTLNIERAKKICRRIIEESLNHIEYTCITRIDKSDRELFELFVQAGFKKVNFGMENASPRILNSIQKMRSKPAENGDYGPELLFLDTLKKNIEMAKSFGLITTVSIIQGLPGETLKEAEETMKFLDELKPDYYVHNYFVAYAGTKNFETCGDFGIEKRPSPIQFPYYREFAYNVYEIMPNRNALNIFFLEGRNNAMVLNFHRFFGIGTNSTYSIVFNPGVSILIDGVQHEKESTLFAWMSTFMEFTGEVFFVDNDWSHPANESRWKRMTDAGLPMDYRMVKKEETTDANQCVKASVYKLRDVGATLLSTEKYEYKDKPDYVFDLSSLNGETEVSDTSNSGVGLFTKIKTIGSLKELEDICALSDSVLMEMELKREEIEKFDFEIMDKCRWSGNSCNACSMKKLIVRDNEEILTCYSGQPVGKTGIAFDVLRSNLETLRSEVQNRRGCAQCPIKDRCSSCFSLPAFLSGDQYCETKKRYKNVPVIIEIFSLIHELKIQHGDLIGNSRNIKISWSNQSESTGEPIQHETWFSSLHWILKVNIDDQHYFLYYPATRLFSKLSGIMATLWDRLPGMKKPDKENVCNQIMEERGFSYGAVSNTYDMLISKMMQIMVAVEEA